MIITDGAKKLLEVVLSENGAEGVRLLSVEGCCGPQFALSLDAPQSTDTVKVINGISVAMDAGITDTEELTLDSEEGEDGTGLVLFGAGGCGGGCGGDCDC